MKNKNTILYAVLLIAIFVGYLIHTSAVKDQQGAAGAAKILPVGTTTPDTTTATLTPTNDTSNLGGVLISTGPINPAPVGNVCDKVFSMGGFFSTTPKRYVDPNDYLDDVWLSSNMKDWTNIVPNRSGGLIWPPNSMFTTIYLKGNMYLMGGQTPNGSKDEFWSSVDGKTWQKLPTPIGAVVFQRNFTTYNGKIWGVGGSINGTMLNSLWSFDGTVWKQYANAPWTPRIYTGLVEYDSKLWVIGGLNSSGSLDEVWSFNENTLTWKQEPSLPYKMIFRGGGERPVSYNNNIYLIAPVTSTETNEVYMYDKNKGSWQQLPNAGFNPREGYVNLVYKGLIYTMGGFSNNGGFGPYKFYNDIWSFDGSSWSKIVTNSVWSPRREFDAAVLPTSCLNPLIFQKYEPKITVRKVVVGGGPKNASNFQLFVDSTSVTNGIPATFSLGAHKVSEINDPDYTATYSGECDKDGNINLKGPDLICVITNTYTPRPDLMPDFLSIKSSDMGSASGPVIDYSVQFTNAGKGPAILGPNTHFTLTRDSDGKVFSDVTPFLVPYTIQAGGSYTYTDGRRALPKGTGICGTSASGTVSVTAKLDATDNIKESNETNNTKSYSIFCQL